MKTLRLVLGDQLHHGHSWFEEVDDEVTFVMMELRSETDYVRHHVQKVVAFFLAMRLFSEEMQERGHRFHYIRLDNPENAQSFPKTLQKLIEEEDFERFEYQLPDEYRLDEQLSEFCQGLDIAWEAVDSEHFLTERMALHDFFKGKKTYLMESFYRDMRKKYDLLMDEEGKPAGGDWNYDSENRNRYDGEYAVPDFPWKAREVSDLLAMVEEQGVDTFGEIDAENFPWAVTREEGLAWLDFFCRELLPHFGRYQDALAAEEAFLFHSRLSFLMNCKLLSPLEVVRAAIQAWKDRPKEVSLPQIEGFVRQIIGWREYMRGVYWAHMPDYRLRNFFEHERPLPSWFWTGDTKMNCLQKAIGQSLQYAYAHHIQRLMVTGNFALLAGISPDDLDDWYLGIYIDALEWVEITNTRGMSQFADGGLVGTKPYVSSANYIDKMSDYCSSCHYAKSKRTGEGACPFNSLYWDFYARNEDKLRKNPRIGMAYRTWERMGEEKQKALRAQAAAYLQDIENL